MLETLLKIGAWQSKGMTEWSRFLNASQPDRVDRGESITYYVVGITFDLDEEAIYLDVDSLQEYDEEDDPEALRALSIQGGNNKAIYATVEPSKLVQLFKTFFGKPDNEQAVGGELMEAIDKSYPQFQNTDFYGLLQQIFLLRTQFLEKVITDGKFDYKAFFEPLQLGRNDNLVLAFSAVKAIHLGYNTSTPIAQLATYQEFLAAKFFGAATEKTNTASKLCYASGEFKEDVAELSLSTRYSLNKMFVTETKNYASLFDKKAFSLNYQVSQENQEKLDLASGFLLDRYKTRIADIDHVIIPQFLERADIDLNLTLEKISLDAQLLFSLQSEGSLNAGVRRIQNYGESVFWINFLAYESDGNFFKTIGLIKDISRFHFEHILDAFREVNQDMETTDTVNWSAVTTEYGKPSIFNLYLAYGLIPVREDKEKKNVALQLFKAVLERRMVTKEQLFEHFSELMLCHYYGRYKSYTNVRAYSNDYFGLAIRDSVFKYLAFIQVLRKLNLINMESEEITTTTTEEVNQDHERRIDDFFAQMQFSNSQRAMFFLGRMLNAVAYIQKDKNRTVIDKLNYNGMDKDDIVRLRISLFEKAKQYSKTQNVVFSDARFGQYFDFENWRMNPQEALFFILTGYSFGAKKKLKDSSNHD